ncbi:MAG: DUF4388 domain-containing protein [Sandaracinaceae bacterium]|nr:DUF4388 domain-containing protein [Sandaracinaceae bacterium]
MSTVVVVDPDPRERARLASGLRDRKGLAIVSCADVEEALLACPSPPALVIVGLTAEQCEDAAVVNRALRKKWPSALVVLAVDDDGRLPTLDIGHRLHLFARPASLQRLALLLRREATSSQVDLPRVSLPDLVQLACLGGHTMRISCSREGHDVGTVDVVGGKLVSARDAEGRGLPALSRLLSSHVAARVRELLDIPSTDLSLDWQHALFEAMKLADEAPRAASFEELMESLSQALLERDYARAAEALGRAAELRPDDALVKVNLERLRKLGYVVKKGSDE